MKNVFKKSLMLIVSFLLTGVVWAADPTLAINADAQGTSNFVIAYKSEGIVLSSTASFSSGAVQIGNTAGSYDQHYFEILADATIDSVSFLLSGNGSDKSIQAPVFGWQETATSNTADTYRILDAVTVSANSYAAAQWFTYDFSVSDVKCVRIYRSSKTISSVEPAYTGTSSALGSNQTIKIWGLKIWLSGSEPQDQPVEKVTITGPEQSAVGVPFKLTAKAIGGQASEFWWTEGAGDTHISDKNVLEITPESKGTYVYKAWARNEYNTDPVSATHTIEVIVPSGEIIKANTQQVVTGTVGGTFETNLNKGETQKLNKGYYFGVTLANGTFAANDTFVINITVPADLGKCMIYADKEGNDLIYDEGIVYTKPEAEEPVICPTGLKKIVLPETVNGKSSIYLYRENGNTQWNPTFSYIAVIRPEEEHVPVPVTGVSIDSTEISIEEGKTATLTAIFEPINADNKKVTWSSDADTIAKVVENGIYGIVTGVKAGNATITVKTDDGKLTATCAVKVIEPAAPIEVESISIKDSTTIFIGGSDTLSVTYMPEDANTGKAITWTSDADTIAKVDVNYGIVTGVAAGTAHIIATTENGKTDTCVVTVKEIPVIDVTSVSLDNHAITIKENETVTLTATVLPENATNKAVDWKSDSTRVATVSATGVVTGVAAGTTNIIVITKDGNKTDTCVVTVIPEAPVPQTDLTIHYPGIYEEVEAKGGYGKESKNGYEVFYAGRWDNGGTKLTIHVNPKDKSKGITKNETNSSYEAIDGWFKGSGTDKGTGFDPKEEFAEATSRCHTMTSSNSLEMHISGYDQFSLYAADKKWEPKKPADCKYFKVSIDDVPQTMEPSTSPTIRRFDLPTSGEHVIKISLVGDGNLFGGFSLREAHVPRTKRLNGNDSTQVLLQTTSIKPVYYFTKYNDAGRTEVIWEGEKVDSITLQKGGKGDLGDTLILTGKAMCPVGTYKYRIACFEGTSTVEMNSVPGSFKVTSSIKPMTDTIVEVFQDELMDPIQMRYYALDTNVHIQWKDSIAPEGITWGPKDGKFTISGVPRAVGVYDFEVSVDSGNSVQGQIEVRTIDLEHEPILYLYKSQKAYERDGVYQYLESKGKNLVARKTTFNNEPRDAEQYKLYKWIIISDDADADNKEILNVTTGGANLPILNMKSFSYSYDRLGWGEPNNGSLTENARFLTVQRDDHPIFKALGKKRGEQLQVLTDINKKGLMPIAVNQPGTICLATAYTRSQENYDADGDLETFIHEVPSSMRGGTKYICMPISINSSNNLTDEGKKLVDAVVEYLLNDEPTVTLPARQITRFTIGEANGVIRETNDTIIINVDLTLNPDVDPKAVVPTVTIADEYTHVVPASGDTVDLSLSAFSPTQYVVTDYINRRVYDVIAHFFASHGIEEVYTTGEWVTIYDIFGRKIVTTNENIYTMQLPHGVYVAVTETGQAIKITR